jgi:endonuclease/exonuclease/phosphatase family metal-dependent hydrolase
MRNFTVRSSRLNIFILLAACFTLNISSAQNTVNLRVMAANLNGNTQSYQPFALRILQGLKPDVVAIQEFNYASTNGVDVNNAAAFREMLNTALGTNFVYFRESGSYNIPNGIISRYPILASGSWSGSAPDRGYAWAQIQLPGTNMLYVVSVHLLTSSASVRSIEATALKNLIQSNFPTNAWIVLAGDFNTDSRAESTTMTTCDSYLSDTPVPLDDLGDSDTSINRNHPHDYVLPSFNLTSLEAATVFATHTYPSGLVFDSRVYSNLTDFAPVQSADSGLAQHMAVIKDFSIPSGSLTTNPPAIATQPQSQAVAAGNSVTFSVTVSGTSPFSYQWLFNGTNISGATNNPFVLASAQLTNAGNYSVVVTNLVGSATSSNAVLNVSNAPPVISIQPQNQNILASQSATFSVSASGTLPLNYQWLLGGTNISGATTNPFVLPNVQSTNAGNYSVVITNIAGSVTSSVASLSILFTNPVVFAQWNFNSAPPDASSSTGSTLPSFGNGTASTIGGIVPSFVGGDPVLDPATADNTAWTTTTYPAATVNNKTAGVQFAVSTAGKQNITIAWSQRSSNTGGKYFRLQYSTNGGSSFLDFPSAVIVTNVFSAFTNDLSVLINVNNNSNFVFRIVSEFQSTATGSGSATYIAAGAGSTYAGGGTTRFDMVTVSGTAILTGAPAVLNATALTGGQFSFTVSGTAGLNYTVQSSTNLAATNWVPILTRNAPFLFGDTNISAPQKFYRAVSQ